jgi:P27 family predicted phage terminase small subunit
MGLRGPKPQSTATKIAAGNPGRRRLNEDEPIPPPGEVLAPSWMSEQAKRIWAASAPVLSAMKVLTTADVLFFARYCETFARWLELQDFLMRKGAKGTTYATRDEKGKVRYVHELPQAAEFRRLSEILIRMEDRFGMNPSARSRIRIEGIGAAAPAQLTEDQMRDKETMDFFAGGGPMPPRLVSGSSGAAEEKTKAPRQDGRRARPASA